MREEVDAGALWEMFHDELHGFVLSRVKSAATAEDILQTAFLSAHEKLSRGEGPEQPRAWLYQVVRNLMVDVHRRETRDSALARAVERAPERESRDPSPEPGLDDDPAFVLVARSLPRFIERLETPYRDALQMTELEGLSQAEAADRAGISLSGMKSRVQRGRKQVFAALQRCCEFERDGRGRMVAYRRRTKTDACCTPSP